MWMQSKLVFNSSELSNTWMSKIYKETQYAILIETRIQTYTCTGYLPNTDS